MYYNVRLLLYLLFVKTDIICAIDLDTIVPAWMAATLRGKKLVYDAHEYFTEVEEISERPAIQKIWRKVESTLLPKIKYAYTINQSFAEVFKEKYALECEIIRNATILEEFAKPEPKEKYILYQGAVNMGRGLEQMIEAMRFVNCKLVVCGHGDILEKLIQQVKETGLENKVEFKGHIAPEELKKYTREAFAGLTLFRSKGFNNYYSLANRFFDYMHAEIPQLIIDLPEYRRINTEYELGILVTLDVQQLADAANRLLNDAEYYQKLATGAANAKKQYNWQNEEKKLIAFYNRLKN